MKFYIFSDCHGYYDELKSALDKSGFDPNNEEHWLIGCGDYLDRGRQPQQVIDYLMSLPRKILVKGNHEELILDCIERGYPRNHDISNGTAQTISDLAPNAKEFDVICAVAYEKIKDFIDSMVDYVELKDHIFVHSFIPLINMDGMPPYYTHNRWFKKKPNWREATTEEWEDSRWGNPFDLAEKGFLPEKTLIFGHWSTEHKWAEDEGRLGFDEDAKFEPYYGDGYIGIDGCTVYSKKVNVITIEDEFLEV